MNVRTIQFCAGLFLLMALELLRVDFFISPSKIEFSETSEIANFVQSNIFYLRTIGILIVIFPTVNFLWTGSNRTKGLTALALTAYIVIFYFFNYRQPGISEKASDLMKKNVAYKK